MRGSVLDGTLLLTTFQQTCNSRQRSATDGAIGIGYHADLVAFTRNTQGASGQLLQPPRPSLEPTLKMVARIRSQAPLEVHAKDRRGELPATLAEHQIHAAKQLAGSLPRSLSSHAQRAKQPSLFPTAARAAHPLRQIPHRCAVSLAGELPTNTVAVGLPASKKPLNLQADRRQPARHGVQGIAGSR